MKTIVQLDLFCELQNEVPLKNKRKIQKKKKENKTLEEKIESALRLLKLAVRGSSEPIEISYSGGKDSDVILELAKMAGIPYKAIYRNTTIDPPGTIVHCSENGVEIYRRKTFAEVIRAKGFPTRTRRFCCSELKEYKILNRAVQGIRRCESVKRNKLYKESTICKIYGGKEKHVEVFLPILDWSDTDVSRFIEMRHIKCHTKYYDEKGCFHPERRLGCMGCPLKSDNGLAEFKAHPKLVRFWLRNGEIWWNTHKLKKTKKLYKNHYELFTRNIFFTKYEDFKEAIEGLFGSIDCKNFLEEYFDIKLTT